jgi:hypothetical protein
VASDEIVDTLAAEYDRLRELRMDLLADLEANRIALDRVLLAMAKVQDKD